MSMCCVRNVDCSKGLSCDQKIIELRTRAANDPLVFTVTEKAPTRAFSLLKAPTSASIFKIRMGHYAIWALTHGK